jgi:hypothetical protein
MKVTFGFRAEPRQLALVLLNSIVLARNGPLDYRPLGHHGEPEYIEAVGLLVGGVSSGEERLTPEVQEEILHLWDAILGWASGEEAATYLWQQADDHFPIDDGVRVGNATLEVWVKNSHLRICRLGDGLYGLRAWGARHSFAENHTGGIAEAIVGLAGNELTDLELESQATQPWDNELRNLFRPTRLAQVERALFNYDLSGRPPPPGRDPLGGCPCGSQAPPPRSGS